MNLSSSIVFQNSLPQINWSDSLQTSHKPPHFLAFHYAVVLHPQLQLQWSQTGLCIRIIGGGLKCTGYSPVARSRVEPRDSPLLVNFPCDSYTAKVGPYTKMEITAPTEPIKILLILQTQGISLYHDPFSLKFIAPFSHLHGLFHMSNTDLNTFICMISLDSHKHHEST